MPILSKASKDEFDSPVERLLASVANLRQQPTAKGAHFYRTSLRRFEAWSDVFHPRAASEQKQALKFLDKLRKATGKLRDSEVHLDLLGQLSGANSGEKRKLEKTLRSRRNSYEKKLKALLRDPILAGIWSRLRVLGEVEPQDSNAKEPHTIAGMGALALDEYRAFVQRRGTLSADNLHAYRLECKRFRYTAELAGDTPEIDNLIATWKEVQDVIGEWHDYLTLAEVADDVLNDSPLHATLQEMTDKKFTESLRAVEKAEQSLTGEIVRVPKKGPRRARSGRRSSPAA